MPRNISDEDVEAIARRVVGIMTAATGSVIEANAVYTTKEASVLVRMHPKTLAKKIRCGLVKAKGGHYRIKGSELLKLA